MTMSKTKNPNVISKQTLWSECLPLNPESFLDIPDKNISTYFTCFNPFNIFGLRFLVFILLFLFNYSSAHQKLVFNDTINNYSVGNSLLVFEDTTAALPYDSVISSHYNLKFIKTNQTVPFFGYSNSVFWFKFDIEDSSFSQKEWVLEVAMPNLHNIGFYIIDSSRLIDSSYSGFAITSTLKKSIFQNPSIVFNTSHGTKRTIIIRIKSESSIIVPVFLREKSNFVQYDQNRHFFLALYFGAIFILTIYFFFLSFSDKGYFWLSLFSATFSFTQLTLINDCFQKFYIGSPQFLLHFLHIPALLSVLLGMILSRYFTNSKKFTPNIDFLLRILQIVILVLIPITPFMTFMLADKIFFFAKTAPIPIYFVMAIIAYRKGYRPALYYLIATTSFLIGIAVFNCTFVGLITYNTLLFYLPNITLVITLPLYSICIIDKVNILKREQEISRKKAFSELEEKLRIQEEKRTIELELEHAKKMEAIGRLLSGVAHDMTNLLSPIEWYEILLKKACSKNREFLEPVNNLIDATARLKDLASTLVNYSRKRPTGVKIFELNRVVNQIGSLLKHSAPKGVSVVINEMRNKTYISADSSLLFSSLLNIGNNAIDALSKGGTITISMDTIELDSLHSLSHKFGISPGQYVTITIHDNGIGMSPEILKHIFEPFFTRNKNGKGTGLGLFNVYNFVKTHKGCIDVQSTLNVGTSVSLYFPLQNVNDEFIEDNSNEALIFD